MKAVYIKQTILLIFMLTFFCCATKDKGFEGDDYLSKTKTDSLLKIEPYDNLSKTDVDSQNLSKRLTDTVTKSKIQLHLEDLVKYNIQEIEEVDFDGDLVNDFILKTVFDEKNLQREYWINSKFEIIRNNPFYSDGQLYRRFINLDEDKEPEIFEVEVFEDGADYVILDQNLENGTDKIILYYNPVIIEHNTYYWGYPWNVTSILNKIEDNKVKLFCSLKHKIIRDGNEVSEPPNQKQMPVIFFEGKHTQEFILEEIINPQWLTLEEIKQAVIRK